MLLPDSVVEKVFVPDGSKYFLAVIAPGGEGMHFHLLYYARRGVEIMLLKSGYRHCRVVVFDWAGKVIEHRYIQANPDLDVHLPPDYSTVLHV